MPDLVPLDPTTQQAAAIFAKMLAQMEQRRPRLDRLFRYATGDADMPWGPPTAHEAFRRFQSKARANWGGLIVEAPRERMRVTGFRTGSDGDAQADADAWRIWQANGLDAGSADLHRAMLQMSEAYAIVGGADADTGAPRITVEDPRQVITIDDPQRRGNVLAAAKTFVDEWTGTWHGYLYTPGAVARLQGPRYDGALNGDSPGAAWAWMSAERVPMTRVPVVRFPNRADLFGRAMGEFEDFTDDIDRINLMLLQRLVVAVMQAFRQRAAKGLPIDANSPASAQKEWADVFRADPGALWALPDGVEMWESGGVDLTPLLESVKADIRDLAAATRTPMFYLFPTDNNSAEGAALQREGLVFKTHDRIAVTSERWERVMSLAFEAAGDMGRARLVDMEAIWSPPERFSLSERYDAASKAQAAGVPWRTVMSDVLQFSPQEIERMEAQRASDVFLADPLAAG